MICLCWSLGLCFSHHGGNIPVLIGDIPVLTGDIPVLTQCPRAVTWPCGQGSAQSLGVRQEKLFNAGGGRSCEREPQSSGLGTNLLEPALLPSMLAGLAWLLQVCAPQAVKPLPGQPVEKEPRLCILLP